MSIDSKGDRSRGTEEIRKKTMDEVKNTGGGQIGSVHYFGCKGSQKNEDKLSGIVLCNTRLKETQGCIGPMGGVKRG